MSNMSERCIQLFSSLNQTKYLLVRYCKELEKQLTDDNDKKADFTRCNSLYKELQDLIKKLDQAVYPLSEAQKKQLQIIKSRFNAPDFPFEGIDEEDEVNDPPENLVQPTWNLIYRRLKANPDLIDSLSEREEQGQKPFISYYYEVSGKGEFMLMITHSYNNLSQEGLVFPLKGKKRAHNRKSHNQNE